MKIKKIYIIPAWHCNCHTDHSKDSDPVKIWMWDRLRYNEEPNELIYDDFDDYNYHEKEEYSNPNNKQTHSTEITIITGKKKEIFSIDETVSDNQDNEFLLKYFLKNINTCSIKKLKKFKAIFKLSIEFAEEYMKELIYNGEEYVEDESQIKSFLEQYLWHINNQIRIEEERINNTLRHYDL